MATVDELCENFTKVGLTRECEKLGLPAIGGKRDIAKKIINHRNMTNSGGENGEDDRDPQKDGVCEKDDSHTEDAERGVVGSCEKDGSHSDNEERAERDGFSTNGEDDEADNDDSEDNESDDMFQTAIRTNTSTPLANRLRASRRTKVYSFRDMEESIESFGAEEGEDVRLWLMQLKGVCKAARWDDEQQLIMCRKKLTGTAKRFVFSLRSSFSSFKKLEQALIREFAPRVRASDVHRALTNRKKKNSESIRDYIYEMQRLALPIELDEPSPCEYIVNGITDDEHHQTILYEAQSIERLKRKLLNFERVMKDSKNKKKRDDFGNRKEKAREKENNTMSKKRSCFNCGETSHVSADCPQKGAGPKCFSCNTFGHRARECKKGGTSSQKEKQNVLICGPSVEPNHSEHPPSSVTKWEDEFTSKRSSEKQVWLQRTIIQVKVESVIIDALFDTGSPMNLMTHYTYEKIGKPCLSTTTMKLKGFGGNEIAADGVFQVDMCIDCHQYRDVLFYLVPNKSMSFAAVLGTASLQHFDVKVTTNGVQVLKREECEIMDIMLCENEIDVPKQYASEVKSLISNYVPCEDVKSTVEMKILLEDEHPVQTNPRRFAPKEKEVLEKTVNEWLNAGIIRESNSDYASPVVLAKKKDGSMRVCVDYRELNRKIKKDCFPMRNMEDQIDKLQGAKVFTTLDLKNSFFHVPIEKSSQKYTAFVTHTGQYEFLRAPFGLCNSPACFSRFVANAFRELIKSGEILVYVDDLIIATNSEEENIITLKKLFKAASANGIEFNWKKSQFLKPEVEYLGFVIKDGTYSISPDKLKAINSFPVPRNVKELQRFLGLTSYFRKFIECYAIMAKPLTDLMRKNVEYEFTNMHLNCFERLKKCLVSDPVLKIYEQKAATEVHTDASKEGYGAVLLQKGADDHFHPVYYMSHQTNDAEKNYSAYHLEVLAVVRAVEKFRVYLLGIPFKIVTDCSAFQHTFKAKELSARIARWALMLEEYDYKVIHRPGTSMRHVDALSRAIMIVTNDPVVEMIITAQKKDERISAIRQLLTTQPYDDYCMNGEVVMKLVKVFTHSGAIRCDFDVLCHLHLTC
ncbi:uncharacterized protein LOC118502383 [Anopheles stephensi]|uniref:uncharacterized protein LOC118502383 n=1 Tax=Anopheles stephensi TaxID=30069 RepID=UPI00165892FF|nr:uncharacterized protein LOC118502383 [Anopheles stephensi]